MVFGTSLMEQKFFTDSRTEMGLHAKYLSRKDRALATIVLSLEPSLLYLIGNPDDPGVVWKKLADHFQKKTWANKLALRRILYSFKLKEGDSVHNHIRLMTETFDELSVIGDSLNEEDRIVHLLASLPESYDMLVTALEASQDVPKWALVTERLLYEENKMREKQTGGAESKAMTSKHHINKKGPKCFHCGKFWHLKCNCCLLGEDSKKRVKRNYPKKKAFLTKKTKVEPSCSKNEHVVGLFAHHALTTSNNEKSSWIVDSGATCHMYHDIDKFINMKKLDKAEDITLDDGHSVKAFGIGTVDLNVRVSDEKQQKCRLFEILYVPKLSYNLLSVSKATRSGKSFIFTESRCHLLDEKRNVVATGSKVGNMYYLNCIDEQESTHAASICSSGDTNEGIWHRRFSHLGMKNLQKLATDQLVNWLGYNVTKDIKFCEPCVDGKHHRSSFPNSGGRRATKLLEIVHSDVCGRLEAKSHSGAEYFVTFIDDKSRYVWIYILKNKSELLKKGLEWKSMVKKSSGEKSRHYALIMVVNTLQKSLKIT